MANNAKLPDLLTLLQAGINPKTGLPLALGDNKFKKDMKALLRVIDEQDAVNRYTWYNLPCDISSEELERLLYYKGQLCFFYFKELDKFFFMPYALDGTIDFYGRYNRVHPVPMTSGNEDDDKKQTPQSALLSQLKLDCKYGVVNPLTLDEETLTKSCVLLHDYTKQLSQTVIARQILNDPLLDLEATMIPYLRLALLNGTGVRGVRVKDATEAQNVKEASLAMEQKALRGEPLTPIIGNIDFQELTNGATSKAEEYLLSMQSLDNLRLSTHGLENGGLFEKKAHILEDENKVNQSTVGLVFEDGLRIRQHFCNIVNSIWGLGIWCEPAEAVLGMDNDMDGNAYDDDTDAHGTGIEDDDSDMGGYEDEE